MRLSDVSSAAVRALLGNASLVRGILAINAGGAATVKTTAALSYTIDGILYAKAALAAQAITVTHGVAAGGDPIVNAGGYVQPINTTVYYTLALNAAGTVAVVQGAYDGQIPTLDPTKGIGSLAAVGTSAVGNGNVPNAPDGYTAIGIIKVVTNGATTFTPGTTLLDAAGLAITYFDVCLLPSVRP
jgi:hypothetical protein